MIKAILTFAAILGLSSAGAFRRVHPSLISQREMAPSMFKSASNYPMMSNLNSRFGAGCGPSTFSCTSPKKIQPQGEVSFASGYSSIYLTTESGYAPVYLDRPDGSWFGGADARGCSSFGGFSGDGESKVGNMGDVAVAAWACA
uniref:Lectin Hc-hypninA-1 n=1 Tax=Hypnea cervicornis TaxID=387623 RepID=A0A218PFP2_HYPCE|nr:lectin Hc-hypninA-1 precursor [Hypnea cervicornis]